MSLLRSDARATATRTDMSVEEPPAGVAAELLWRVAARLLREHTAVDRPDGDPEPARCRCCQQPWPCSGRRLAELGLHHAASRPAPTTVNVWL